MDESYIYDSCNYIFVSYQNTLIKQHGNFNTIKMLNQEDNVFKLIVEVCHLIEAIYDSFYYQITRFRTL